MSNTEAMLYIEMHVLSIALREKKKKNNKKNTCVHQKSKLTVPKLAPLTVSLKKYYENFYIKCNWS